MKSMNAIVLFFWVVLGDHWRRDDGLKGGGFNIQTQLEELIIEVLQTSGFVEGKR